MCGISGVISKNSIEIESFVKMNQIIKHRGPDDEGFVLFNETDFQVLGSSDTASGSWISNELYSPKQDIKSSSFKANIGFGHRRLSILDLSTKGHQPMCSKDQRYWIVYNGEIYNYIEVREELIELGHVFNSDSDTEVILASYQEWGIECQQRFNGMWAFVIFDRHEKILFISRDRFGIKPLYYWFNPNGDFYFASEIKQFTVLSKWKAKLNKKLALDYLYYALTDHTDGTLFTDVYLVPPGHYYIDTIQNLTKNDRKINCIKWYNPSSKKFSSSFTEAKKIFFNTLKESVNLNLRADVPIGSALSGGLDSSSIVTLINLILKTEGKSGVQKTFTSCTSYSHFDERYWAEELVKHITVDSHFIYPNGKDIFNLTEKIVWHMDEPYQSQSAFLGYHIFEKANENNLKILLNGQGADEYLSAYGVYNELRKGKLLRKFKIKSLLKEFENLRSFSKFLISYFSKLLPPYFHNRLALHFSRNKFLDSIINHNILNLKLNHFFSFVAFNKFDKSRISSYQLLINPLPRYLRWEDRNSMAHSVEARVPFLDYRLVEFVHSLPLDFLDESGNSKKILLESMKDYLPQSVYSRKDKRGFVTPEEMWLRKDYKNEFIEFFKQNVKYSKGIIDYEKAKNFIEKVQNNQITFDYTYWRLILFCIWMKVFDVQVDE